MLNGRLNRQCVFLTTASCIHNIVRIIDHNPWAVDHFYVQGSQQSTCCSLLSDTGEMPMPIYIKYNGPAGEGSFE